MPERGLCLPIPFLYSIWSSWVLKNAVPALKNQRSDSLQAEAKLYCWGWRVSPMLPRGTEPQVSKDRKPTMVRSPAAGTGRWAGRSTSAAPALLVTQSSTHEATERRQEGRLLAAPRGKQPSKITSQDFFAQAPYLPVFVSPRNKQMRFCSCIKHVC